MNEKKLKPPVTVEKINEHIRAEFGKLYDEFYDKLLPLSEARKTPNQELEQPGVYIYLRDYNVIKVGKSNINARKRALQHITDNTQTKDGSLQMKSFQDNSNVSILFYILKSPHKTHWLIALEDYLEHSLEVKIKSRRRN